MKKKEDKQLQKLIEKYGAEYWSLICQLIPNRFGKSCRLRWCDQPSPQIDDQPFTPEEDDTITKAYAKFRRVQIQLFHYPPVAPPGRILPLLVTSVVSLSAHYLIRWNFASFTNFTSNVRSINIFESLFT
ncbi:hypothetical protein H5410_047468 [Solanum commersonii]|uniref:HTH myb-type domain-containing protein n=1 Tax=Solanum commersonii TaxID=4109 RepID=A0A9J5XH67_SOLCO|nr:hypothetical protein H5410_047468 [Solanum commersonii]